MEQVKTLFSLADGGTSASEALSPVAEILHLEPAKLVVAWARTEYALDDAEALAFADAAPSSGNPGLK